MMKSYYYKLTLLFTAACLFLLCFINNACAATLVIENDVLMGAKSILIDGTSYDVVFVDGTADAIYLHEGTWDFTFTSEEGATAASQALIDQVFGGVYNGTLYDTNPEMTNGIIDLEEANIYTPYRYELDTDRVYLKSAINYDEETDAVGGGVLDPQTSTAPPTRYSPHRVYAQWSPVPIPSTLFLLGSGVLCISGISRKRTNV